MIKIFFLVLLLSPVITMLNSCKKDRPRPAFVQQNPAGQNKAPIANAGADQTVALAVHSAVLSGSGTDADGRIVGYEWTKIRGPVQYTLVNSYAAVTTVNDLVVGVYEFELKVTDNDGLSGRDSVIVTVVSPSPYRSKQTGDWKDASNWELFDGTHWVDASSPPSDADGQINIREGHNITVSSPAEVNEVVVDQNGSLIIKSDFLFVELTNNGTLDWQDGDICMCGGYANIILTNNGTFLIKGNNNTSSYWWDSDVSIVNNGTITKTSTGFTSLEAAHSVTNNSTGVIQGLGTLSVSGDISWLPGAFNNKGTIAPGLPIGIVAINHVLEPFSSGSVLNIEVKDNSGPGIGHDQLVCNKNIALKGNLMVTEIGTAIANGRFTIITTTGTITGNFSGTNLPPGYSVQINTNSVELVKQ